MVKSCKKRYGILDIIRGFWLLNMVLYHGLWDIVYIYGVDIPWYKSNGAYIWQQCICWSFILLSGFCWSLSRNNLKRSLLVLAGSGIITVITLIFMPESKILFGVLSLIGISMLIMIPLNRLYKKFNPLIGIILCFVLFLFTRNINEGSLGFFEHQLVELPEVLYSNMFTAFLGFPHDEFFSTDYFAVFPWIFLYQTGYFLYQLFVKMNWLERIPDISFKPLEWIGKNSLYVYMAHQPVVYAVLWLGFTLF